MWDLVMCLGKTLQRWLAGRGKEFVGRGVNNAVSDGVYFFNKIQGNLLHSLSDEIVTASGVKETILLMVNKKNGNYID